MNIRIKPRPHGIALIIVMVVIVVLAGLAGIFAYAMKVETKLARNASMDPEMDWLGRSGVELAKYILAQEFAGQLGRHDTTRAKWAGGPGYSTGTGENLNESPVAFIPMDHYELGNGWFSVKIVDNDRKMNINKVINDAINTGNVDILVQALTLIGVDAASHQEIISSLMDWCDNNKSTRNSGAESDYYKTLDPPYIAKDAPIDDLTELLLVKGITPDMYWGSSVSGHQIQVLNRDYTRVKQSKFAPPIYRIGFVDLFTPLSSGLVNMNTASDDVLQLIPQIDKTCADAFLGARGAGPDRIGGTPDDGVADLQMFPCLGTGPPGSAAPGAPPPVGPGGFFSGRSLVFEVQVDAYIGNYHRKYIAVLRRSNQRDIQTLSFYWKTS